MILLAWLKERFLDADRADCATRATETVERFYANATDLKVFYITLTDGDLERAAEHSTLSADELCERI